MRGRVILLLLMFAMVVAPAVAGGDASDMAGRAAAWAKAYNAGDSAGVAALYTEDSVRMPYQAPTVEGRGGIVANLDATRELGIASADLAVLGAESAGNMAWGHGTYKLMDGDGNVVQTGKWMNVSRKVGKSWMIQADIWNTNEPDTAPE